MRNSCYFVTPCQNLETFAPIIKASSMRYHVVDYFVRRTETCPLLECMFGVNINLDEGQDELTPCIIFIRQLKYFFGSL